MHLGSWSSQMKKCIRCGAENKDENNFCSNCGAALNVSKPSFTKNENIIDRFRNANILVKLIIIISVIIVILLISGMAAVTFFGVPLDPFTEDVETRHLEDFKALDSDGDGALSFDEAACYAPDIDYDVLSDIFDNADRNNNSLLIGGEFDLFVDKINHHYKDLEKQKQADKKAVNKSSSSSHGFTTVKTGKCPGCGSPEEYIYDYYDEFGRPYYQCTVCDYKTYDEGDFYDE